MNRAVLIRIGVVCLLFAGPFAQAQTGQAGADRESAPWEKLRVEYVGYRSAQYETEHVTEVENARPNQGGLISVYLTNFTDEPVSLAFYRANGQDESYWRLGGFLAWDRVYAEHLPPGKMTVLEINAVSKEFAPGSPFEFAYVDRTWRPAVRHDAVLEEDPLQVSLLRVLPGMDRIEVHMRHRGEGKVHLRGLGLMEHSVHDVEWVGAEMSGPGHAIARCRVEPALKPAELAILRVLVEEGGEERAVYAHRRAFEDWFPIGCWSHRPETHALLRRLHIGMVVEGGTAENPFYKETAAKYGLRTMCPAEKFNGLDTIRSLADHPAVACWMLADEPDWSTESVVMLYSNEFVRRYNQTKPTFITLCRNVMFFEYAPICDIPCMDHYAVTAPSSSKWPEPYGTRLEETAYYTRDLKIPSEPKPIWVWTQGIAGWDQRPKRPVPTPNELAAQLMLNLGRGAKGIIWFNYDHDVAEEWPDTRDAMRLWGRVLSVVKDDMLGAEPLDAPVQAPDKVDAVALASWDKLFLCVTNLDYEIHPEAYPFRPKQNVELEIALPPWLEPAEAMTVSPDGIEPTPFQVHGGRAVVQAGEIEACKLIVLVNDPAARTAYEAAHAKAVADESRSF